MYNFLIPIVLYILLLSSNGIKSKNRFITANVSITILIVIFYISFSYYEITARFDNLKNAHIADLSEVGFLIGNATIYYENLVYHFIGFLIVNLVNLSFLYLKLYKKESKSSD